jgi:predicted DNA-binding transcriptional regulator YafY
MPRPATRVLAVLDLLQGHGRMGGPELARRIGVDGRTLRRYIAALEEMGVPVTSERGRHGAYLLVAGFRLPPMMFTNDEAVALAVGMVAARGLGLADAAPAIASAQSKLARVMPAALQGQVHAISDTVTVDLRGAATAPSSNAALRVLSAAARAQQRVRLGYTSAQGVDTKRDIDPYGLAFYLGAWYAVGWCHLRRDLRSFRLDRVRSASPLPASFLRPDGFDALARLRESVALLPRAHAIAVRLECEPDAARLAFPAEFGLIEPVDGSGVLLRTSADDLGWFARRLAALPFGFRIVEPDALRAALVAHVETLRERIGPSPAQTPTPIPASAPPRKAQPARATRRAR